MNKQDLLNGKHFKYSNKETQPYDLATMEIHYQKENNCYYLWYNDFLLKTFKAYSELEKKAKKMIHAWQFQLIE